MGSVLVLFGVFMVALPWALHQILSQEVPVPSILGTSVAAGLWVTGMALWLTRADAFSRRGRGTPAPTDAPRHLGTDGLLRVIRNPLIAGEVMVIWGEALYVGSLGIFVCAALFTMLAQWVVVRVEEPELRELFGKTYDAYCREVSRLLPHFGLPQTSEKSQSP